MSESFSRVIELAEPAIKDKKMSPNVIVNFEFGLTVGLENAVGSFFAATVDTDASYKLYSNCCAGRALRRANLEFLVCAKCSKNTGYLASANNLWLSAGGVKLEIEKAHRREVVADGRFKIPDPVEIENFLTSHEFIQDLVAWVEPYFDSLEAPVVAWELSEELDTIWQHWKQVKRIRGADKKKAALEAFCDAESR